MAAQKNIGLARALSKLGYCSRTQASILIRAGRVALKGRIVRDPEVAVQMRNDRIGDEIKVDGAPIRETPAVYLILNKPRGVVTTASDEKGRNAVYDLLDPALPWVGPVGRLDKASEGLLLLTNDSEWAAKITDPVRHVDKKYHVQVDCVADDELLAKMIRGQASGGENLRAKAARLLRHGDKNSWLEITLDEGKNRQIRRLLEALNVRVLRLVRVSVGPLELGELKKGATRQLTPDEKKAMDRALRLT
ncbi:MAG: pseudouridine synthase [Terriglobales bacterium]